VAAEPAVAVWHIDPKHTFVEFAVAHMAIATVRGRFEGVSGTIRADDAHLADATVEVEIDAASLDTHDPRRNTHLRSSDFLDVERHPSIRFRSTGIEQLAPPRLRLRGDLTIRGVVRPVVIEAALLGRQRAPDGGEVAGFTGEIELDRRDFGLVWNASLDAGADLVGETVKIRLDLEAIRQG
jgi:polyisoprenoid-binding protein YceI